MLDAVVGAVIMVVATSSLLYSIEVAEKAFDQAGRYSLNEGERELLQSVGSVAANTSAHGEQRPAHASQEIDKIQTSVRPNIPKYVRTAP